MIKFKNIFNKDFEDLNIIFMNGCENGDISLIEECMLKNHSFQYLLNKNKLNFKINYQKYLNKAIEKNHMEIIIYLLNNEQLTKFKKDTTDSVTLLVACHNGSLNLVRYLTEDYSWKSQYQKEMSIFSAFTFATTADQKEILEYLVFTQKISKKDLFLQDIDKTDYLFKLRDLNDSLNKDLSIKETKIKKNKV